LPFVGQYGSQVRKWSLANANQKPSAHVLFKRMYYCLQFWTLMQWSDDRKELLIHACCTPEMSIWTSILGVLWMAFYLWNWIVIGSYIFMCLRCASLFFCDEDAHIYIKRMQTDQYTQLLQKGPQGIRKLQPSPYCYCRSSTSDPAIDPHLFAKPCTQAAILHHQSPETKVQTMESCSTSSVTAH